MSLPSPEPILRHAYGYWMSSILATSIRQDLYTHLETGPATVEELAARMAITPRATRALIDALLGMGLVRKEGLRYSNSPEAAVYLVKGKRNYLGGYATSILSTWRDWEQFPEVIAKGAPLHRHENANPANTFWEDMVLGLAPLGFAPARLAAERFQITTRPELELLDVAGGAGAYSATWLELHPNARATLLDWPNITPIAQRYVASFGCADRFQTIDGDMELIDLGEARYDFVFYANIAHGLSAARNTAMFRKIRRALKPGGALCIVGLVPDTDGTGHPLLLLFNANLILNSEEGGTHDRGVYAEWLHDAGFSDISFQSVEDVPLTIVYAAR